MNLKQTQNKLKELGKKRDVINKEIDECYQDILPIIPFKFGVTDHALLEYLKDCRGKEPVQNIHEAKFKILSTVEMFYEEHPAINRDQLKGTIYKLRIGGNIYVIHNDKVITIYPDKGDEKYSDLEQKES